MTIKLNFNDFTLVSHETTDSLIVRVLDNTMFELDKTSRLRNLEDNSDNYIPEGFMFAVRLGKQLGNSTLAKSMSASVNSSTEAVEGVLITTTAVNILTS